MDICFIGAKGHYKYAINDVFQDKSLRITGIAPGVSGECLDEAIESIKSTGNNPVVFDDYIDMLDSMKPDIAVIASNFNMNSGISIAAMARKCNVFVEKPIATSLFDLERLKEAYAVSRKNHNIHLMAMLGTRYVPAFSAAREAIKAGQIGRIRLMNAQKSYKLGVRDKLFDNRETYGGTIPWVGIHAIDWLRWYSGEGFKSVYSIHSTSYNLGHEDLEMTALCQFEMDNDILASVTIDYLRPYNANTHGDDRIRIVGTEGIIEVINNRAILINNEHINCNLKYNSMHGIFSDFINLIRNGTKCVVSAEDSFASTEASLLARLSADEKRVVYFK